VVTVSPVVGNPTASGTALLNAYAAVTTATAAFPVVIKIQPGTYNVGSSPFALSKANVNLQGWGRDITIIEGSGFTVLQMTADARISDLTVTNVGATGFGVVEGIQVESGHVELAGLHVIATNASAVVTGVDIIFSANGRMTDTLVETTATANWTQGIEVISTDPSTFEMTDVDIKAVGAPSTRGLNLGSSIRMNNVHVDSTDGGVEVIATGSTPPVISIGNSRIEGATRVGLETTSNGTSTITVQGSVVGGSVDSIVLSNLSTATVGVADSLISNAVTSFAPNTLSCVGTFNAAFLPLGPACQ
jgi:hypothetical protein